MTTKHGLTMPDAGNFLVARTADSKALSKEAEIRYLRARLDHRQYGSTVERRPLPEHGSGQAQEHEARNAGAVGRPQSGLSVFAPQLQAAGKA